ncbi:MAG: hypothetical protein ACFFD7_00505 [Candidatus Thorarchaeota archaeon]
MVKCKICGKTIKCKDLKHVFQFTLGEMSSTKFLYEHSNLYCFHIDCLDRIGKTEEKLTIP